MKVADSRYRDDEIYEINRSGQMARARVEKAAARLIRVMIGAAAVLLTALAYGFHWI
jgi:hypothetical protein